MTPTTHDEAATLLAELAERGIELRPDGERLRYRPRSAMTGALARRLMAHKAIVLAVLNHPPSPGRSYSVEAEIERFEAACVRSPTGGWVDPGERTACLYSPQKEPETTIDPPIANVPAGWTPADWRDRLLALADRCEAIHPRRASDLRAQAEALTTPAKES